MIRKTCSRVHQLQSCSTHRRLFLQQLEDRRMFVIGAFTLPPAIEPVSPYEGVVDIGDSQGTGALLWTGRHILTAAHVVNANPDGTPVGFEIVSDSRAYVPVASGSVAPGWTGNSFDINDGNDIGLLELAWVAPYGAQRYEIYRGSDELFQVPTVVGYGVTGLGSNEEFVDPFSGELVVRANDFNKRAGSNRLDADGSLLNNELIRIQLEGIATGGTLRFKLGEDLSPTVPYNATAAQIASALDALDGVNINRAVGGPLPAPIYVTFEGVVSEIVDGSPNLVTQSGGLTGPGDPRARLSVLTRGSWDLPTGKSFIYDIDNGNALYDALGTYYGIHGTGQGTSESTAGPNDSGGPWFLGNKIAGIVSGGTSFNVDPPDFSPDTGFGDNLLLGSWGDIGIVTRVSAYQSWIDSLLDDNYDLWLNMEVQPDSADGTPDEIIARAHDNYIELVVNGDVYHRDLLSRINSLRITGFADVETITLDQSLFAAADFPIQIDGFVHEDLPIRDRLVVDRSNVTTDQQVSIADFTIGDGAGDNYLPAGVSLTYSGLTEIELFTGSGNDVIDARNLGINANAVYLLDAFGGTGNDKFYDGEGYAAYSGGPGDDTYHFYDFETGQFDEVYELSFEGLDTIDASAITSEVVTNPPGQNGSASFVYDSKNVYLNRGVTFEYSENITPLLGPIIGPAFGVTFQELEYFAAFAGIGSFMTHTLDIDWQDPPPPTTEGFVDQPDNNGVTGGLHTYTTQGTRTITFTLTNSDGQSTQGTKQVVIDNVGVGPDPNDPTKTALFVGGTAGANAILLTSAAGGINTMIDGVNEGTFAPTGGIYIFAGPGSDVVQLVPPLATPVTVEAGTGDDVVFGGGGNDTLLGQDGMDVLYGMNGDDTLDGGDGLDRLYGLEGNDFLWGGSGNDYLFAGNGNDHLEGRAGIDYLYGEAGNDLILGGEDNDWLDAGVGNDIAIGGLGKDTLYGMDGEDLLIGGTTARDNNLAQLIALWTVWRSTASFNARVTAVGGLISAATVFDTVPGEIITGSGGRDWFVDYALTDFLTDYLAVLGDKRNT